MLRKLLNQPFILASVIVALTFLAIALGLICPRHSHGERSQAGPKANSNTASRCNCWP
jgi:hypothetical protein